MGLPAEESGGTLTCVNGDESEPATFNNRLLIEKDPHQFIEGILISCFATKASTADVYLRFEYINAYRIMEVAITEAKAAEHLGQNIYGSGFNLAIWLHRGAGAYICGEETGLLEALEGKPRLAADQAAVPRRRRGLRQADDHQQRRDAGLPAVHHRARGGVQVDRRAQVLRPEAYGLSGHVNRQSCVEGAAGYPWAS